MLLCIDLFIAALLAIICVVLLSGHGASLIAGYNTASAAEKAKIDKKKLTRAVGKLMMTLAACWLIIASSEIFKQIILLWVGLALFFIAVIVGLILLNTGDRIKK